MYVYIYFFFFQTNDAMNHLYAHVRFNSHARHWNFFTPIFIESKLLKNSLLSQSQPVAGKLFFLRGKKNMEKKARMKV